MEEKSLNIKIGRDSHGNIIVGDVHGAVENVQDSYNTYNSHERRSLAEAAIEIQQLLDQLARTYPVETEDDKIIAVKDIQQKPQLQGKIINALEKGGKKAMEKLVDHPAAAIAIAVYEGFRESKK